MKNSLKIRLLPEAIKCNAVLHHNYLQRCSSETVNDGMSREKPVSFNGWNDHGDHYGNSLGTS